MRRSCIASALLLVSSLGLCLSAAAQQDQARLLDGDRARIIQAEKDHGPKSKELADALTTFVIDAIDSDIRPITPEFLQAAERSIEVNAAAYGEGSGKHVDAVELASSISADRPEGADLARQAVELARHLSPPDPHVLSRAVVWLGTLCGRIGDYPCALKAYQEGEIAERGSDKPEPEQLGKILNNRAKLYTKLGRNEEALADLRQAYPLVEKEVGVETIAFGQVNKNLGNALIAVGKPDEALPYLEQALRIFSKKFGPTKIHAAQARAALGRAYSVMGKFDQALPLLQEAVGQYRAAYSPVHYEVASVLRMQAQALAAAGKLDQALQVSLESERVSREYFLITAASLPERQALDYAKSREHGLDVALSILAATPELAGETTYEEVVRSRALVADGMAWRNQEIVQSQNGEAKALAASLAEKRVDLAKLATATNPNGPDFADRLTTAREQAEEIERKLAAYVPAFQREQQERAIGLKDLIAVLPAGGALVSYVRYRQYEVQRVDPKQEFIESYAAFVLKPGQAPRFVALGPAKPIDDLVASLRALIDQESDAPGISPTTSLRQYEKVGAKLRRAIWDPVVSSADKSTNTKMYLLVPDGMLHFVNVAALPAQAGGYLIEHVAPIHRLTAERDLLAGAPPASSGLLAVGAADFGFGSSAKPARRGLRLSCSDITKVEFPALPGTAGEIHDVADVYRKSNAGAPVFELTGNNANKQEFLSKAESQSVLHLATHAYFVPAACSAEDAASGKKVESAGLPSENPLLRTGLVFSGSATERLLTGQEISGLSLSGSRWAVLSACDSGIGDVQDGEGVLGLQRAFRVAGVRTVIISLWPVDDESTRRFMDSLYQERFGMNNSTASAIQKATLHSLRQLRAKKRSTHPFYWAGFVAAGDWR